MADHFVYQGRFLLFLSAYTPEPEVRPGQGSPTRTGWSDPDR